MRRERLSDEVRRDQVRGDFPDHFVRVGGLEDHVVVLDAGVDEDGVEGGVVG